MAAPAFGHWLRRVSVHRNKTFSIGSASYKIVIILRIRLNCLASSRD
jgi:hypothetical protein